MFSTRIIQKISYEEFGELIKNKVSINPHAYFRLNQMQRKIYKDDILIKVLLEEKPVLIGIQKNKRYAAFFKRKEGYLKIIFEIKQNNVEIITFYITEILPRI